MPEAPPLASHPFPLQHFASPLPSGATHPSEGGSCALSAILAYASSVSDPRRTNSPPSSSSTAYHFSCSICTNACTLLRPQRFPCQSSCFLAPRPRAAPSRTQGPHATATAPPSPATNHRATLQAHTLDSQPQCVIRTHISQGGIVTTIYRFGPAPPIADPRFPELHPAPLTSRRHQPPRGLRPPPRCSVPQLPSLSSREPAVQHWTCHLHPTSPVSPSRVRIPSGRRVHSPTSSVFSPSPAALFSQESMDLQLPPSFPAYSQYSGTFFSPDFFNSAHVAASEGVGHDGDLTDNRTDTVQLSTTTLHQQVQAEMDAARSISDVPLCDVATRGKDWHVDVQLIPTPRGQRSRSGGASPRPTPAAAAGPHTPLSRVDEHETVSSSEGARPRAARKLDFENMTQLAARLLEAETSEGAKGAPRAPRVTAVKGQRGAAGQPVVPPLFPESPTGRFETYLQQLRDDRPSLGARTAVDSTRTITPRDTARGRPVAAAAAARGGRALLREADREDGGDDDSECSHTAELPHDIGGRGGAKWLEPRRPSAACGCSDGGGPEVSHFCSASSLEDDTTDVDAITTCTVSERSWKAPVRKGGRGPQPLMHEPRVLWRRHAAL